MTDETKAMAERVERVIAAIPPDIVLYCDRPNCEVVRGKQLCGHVAESVAAAIEPEIERATAERREDHATLRNYFSVANAGVNVSRPIGHAIAIHKIAIARLRDAEARVRELEKQLENMLRAGNCYDD